MICFLALEFRRWDTKCRYNSHKSNWGKSLQYMIALASLFTYIFFCLGYGSTLNWQLAMDNSLCIRAKVWCRKIHKVFFFNFCLILRYFDPGSAISSPHQVRGVGITPQILPFGLLAGHCTDGSVWPLSMTRDPTNQHSQTSPSATRKFQGLCLRIPSTGRDTSRSRPSSQSL